jgi:uncharacterized protein YdaU (DUF1376 family)
LAEFPALPLFTDAYLGDTTHLSTLEHGAYLLLLMVSWRTPGCCVPDDDALLARYTRMTRDKWRKVRPILEPFFSIADGFWHQARLQNELQHLQSRREQQVAAGNASAIAKSLKRGKRPSTPVGQPLQRPVNETATPIPIPTSVDKSTGQSPASDLVKDLFDLGVAILVEAGSAEKEARSLIGKWKKSRGEVEVMKALLECRRQEIASPVEWLTKRLQQSRYVSPSGYEYRGSIDDVIRESEKRADWGTYWKAKADRDGREVPKAAGATQ